MNSKSPSFPKRNAILQNKLNVRSSPKVPVDVASRPAAGRAPTGAANYRAQMMSTTQSGYGSGITNSPQVLRPPAGLPSYNARKPIAIPNNACGAHQTPFKVALSKSPRYRKPPVTSYQRSSVQQKVVPPTRNATSCEDLGQKAQNRYKNSHIGPTNEQLQHCESEIGLEAAGDYTDESKLMNQTKEQECVPSFVERYLKQMQQKLFTERPNEFRPSSAVGDIKMEIARVVVAADLERTSDPDRPKGHVTLSAETCHSVLQVLRSRFETLTRDYNTLPVESDTLRTRHRRGLLERELTQVEEGLHVFSRNKVHVRDLEGKFC